MPQGVYITIDVSGMDPLLNTMERLPEVLLKNLGSAVEVSAHKTKESGRENVNAITDTRRLTNLGRAIGYKVRKGKFSVSADIEPRPGRSMAWKGALIEGGTPTSGAHPFMESAYEETRSDFFEGCNKAFVDAWRST